MMFLSWLSLLTSILVASPVAAGADSRKAAKAIWRHSKSWKLKAKKPGGTRGEKVKIGLTLTGRLNGKVAEIKADLRAKVGEKLCTLQFLGGMVKGSYAYQKTTASVTGQLRVKLTKSTCKLPGNVRERFKIPQIPLTMFLIKARLCPGIGSRPMTRKECLKPGK